MIKCIIRKEIDRFCKRHWGDILSRRRLSEECGIRFYTPLVSENEIWLVENVGLIAKAVGAKLRILSRGDVEFPFQLQFKYHGLLFFQLVTEEQKNWIMEYMEREEI